MAHHNHNLKEPQMASPAGNALMKAIEGYRGAHAGEKGHESILSHLERVHSEMLGGNATPQDSPGKREAAGVAHQREIPSERSHEGGDGQVRSNEPGDHLGESERPGEIAPGSGPNHSAGPAPSAGNERSALPSSAGPPGAVSFRTVAAGKGVLKEPAKTSGGNVHSNTPGPPAMKEGRVGDVAAPVKASQGGNDKPLERTPEYIGKEPLGADRWEKAAAGAKKLLKASSR
jgi:hypothetical protein